MEPLLDVTGLSKDHRGLRPLRIASLVVRAGEVLSIGGVDAAAAETLVNVMTGATLPDAGDVTLFGQNTKAIKDIQAWLKTLDGIGMVSPRGVLIDPFSVLQNIAMSLTLEVDPIDPRFLPQARELAHEVGIEASAFELPAGEAGPGVKMRVHVARAVALGARLLVAEHPSAELPREAVVPFGVDLARVARGRGIALVAITADDVLAKAIAGQRLELVPATGELKPPGFLRKLFG
jgi:predicted ABC-type transport system involved in lysophospholipase L1 biosynthesis ATPase subunit